MPVGAVVVCDGQIVGRGRNRREGKKNALHHAEIEAIRQSVQKSSAAGGCTNATCMSRSSPVPCARARSSTPRIKTVYYGAPDPKAGSCGTLVNLFALPYNHKPAVVAGVLEDECADVLRALFPCAARAAPGRRGRGRKQTQAGRSDSLPAF